MFNPHFYEYSRMCFKIKREIFLRENLIPSPTKHTILSRAVRERNEECHHTSPTFYTEHEGSADFVRLVVDEHSELAGVDTCMGLLHGRDFKATSLPLEGASAVQLKFSRARVL